MSFHQSAEDIRVDDGHILRARLRNSDGDVVDAELDLNNCIGNNNGRFEWGSGGFSNSANDISFSVEANGEATVLRANLANIDGDYQSADINLSERISNDNGSLRFD